MALLAGVLALALWVLGCFPIKLFVDHDGERERAPRQGDRPCPSGP
jgi:hypothetical protein